MSIVEKIKTALQPVGRAMATASTFELFQTVTGASDADVILLSEYCSIERDDDTPAIAARRATLSEISKLGFQLSTKLSVEEKLERWINYLTAQVIEVPEEQHGRYMSMLSTAKRELNELQKLIP